MACLLSGCGVLQSSGYDSMNPGYNARELPASQVAADEPPLAVVRITKQLTDAMKKESYADDQKVLNTAITLAKANSQSVYLIGEGDVLVVTVKSGLDGDSLPRQTSEAFGASAERQYTVQTNGQINLPLIGAVKLSGLTEIDAINLIEKLYIKYYKEPKVDLRVVNYRSSRVFVVGDFKKTGSQNISDTHKSLFDVYSKAEGFLTSGEKYTITLQRKDQLYALNLATLVKRGFNIDSIILKNGDVLTASKSDNRVGVTGEANATRLVQIRDNGLSLNEALLEVGGINVASANAKQIYVIRQNNTADPSIFHFSAKSALDLAVAENFYLQGRDIVYVDAVPLARWNRILNLILPGAASIPAARAVTQ
jgi:polysaccharide biosynthesis/export protein